MTEYYTNKSDFENGKNLGFLENNVQQVVDLLNDISKAATIVQENDLSALYIAQGGATLGKDMPENDFTEAEHKVLKIMDALKDIHREVVQNIENKYISGLEDAMESLNKVNEGKNQYKSSHLTYQEKRTTYINNGMAGQVKTTTTRTKHFTLSDILNSDKSPIPAAAAKYSEKLRVAKERLKELEKSDKETYDKIKDVTERELVETFYPTEMGEYKRLKSTWSKDNEQWLGWVDTGIKVVGTVALIVGTVASGGLLAPASLAIGTTLLGGEAAYRAISGETITGEVLSTEQRLWAGAEAVTTLVSGGIGTYMKGANMTERTVSQGLLNADKAARYGANAYDVAQFGHDFNEDPKMALTNLATSQLVGRTIGHLGNKYKAFRASKTGNVDIRSGEATSFKTNFKDRVRTAWTDIKTKAGDVKVQVGEGFDNFKNRVSNMKNNLDVHMETAQSHLDDLYTGAKTKVQQFNQSIAESISQISQPNLSMAGMSHSSSELKNVMNEIDQINFHRAYKQVEFEGNFGSSRGSRSISKPGVETFTNWDEVKLAHRGDLVREIHSKKPKGSPAIKKWFNKGGTIEIETLHDGKQIWRYKSADGTTIPYVQKTLENGMEVHVPDFSEHLHPDIEISTANIEGFTGDRRKDMDLFLKEVGIDEVPDGYIIHHSEPNGTLQLVKEDVHSLFKHYGGYYWYK